MKFTDYKRAMSTFQRCKPWEYSPKQCENALCCSQISFAEHDWSSNENPEHHGTIEINGHREPIIICEDCFHQVEIGSYK